MKNHIRTRIYSVLISTWLASLSSVVLSQAFETVGIPARISPTNPTVAQPTYLIVERWVCRNVSLRNVSIGPGNVISASLHISSPDFSPCPPFSGPLPPLRVRLPLIRTAGNYTLDIYYKTQGETPIFAPLIPETSTQFVVSDTPDYWFETPQQGSVQSGVGLIRGWACDAESVQIQFNDLPLLDAGYGASRADTMEICGDDNNGYGLAYAWGLLGEGEHRMKTYIDGEIVSDVGFQVAHLGEPFVTGLSGSVEVTDFPAPGESVMLEWSEAAQNFVIVEHVK